MSATFTERRIDAEASLRCLEAGRGEVVVVLHGEADIAPTALETMLSQKFRVIALECPGFAMQTPHEAARLIARVAGNLDLERYSLIASTSAAAAALCHVLEAAAQVEALVLVSPSGPIGDLEARLGDIKVATLVLVGTRDKPAASSAARLIADRSPDGYFMVVYDAGQAMENERPDALYEVIADFIERRGRFVLERQESALSP
jgi:pimeloyl-ACP methyl ester carboxylesterase